MTTIVFEQRDSTVLATNDDYQAVFEHCKAVLIRLQGSIKKEDIQAGVLEAAWRYGINPFGLRGTLLFRKMDDGAISITVKSGFKDSFNTSSAVEKKSQEIVQALLNQQPENENYATLTPPTFNELPVNPSRNKTKLAMSLLTFFGGGFGLHKFYTGCWGWGIVYLISCFIIPGVSAVVALVEFIRVLTLSKESFDQKYNLATPKPFSFIW
ncbi:TM2 domain-containing protein [Vibrio metschnikovii]|uniref:TM2 domain-containing protein n=1 Tax=Vibrio metschnikovii TaxID=28172 RepID=UPI001C2F445B|nr:TM2 domain-containing protein [Vibrio metschnikovii]